jgi:hypothetical protein
MIAFAELPPSVAGDLKLVLTERNDDDADAMKQQIEFAPAVRSFARLDDDRRF